MVESDFFDKLFENLPKAHAVFDSVRRFYGAALTIEYDNQRGGVSRYNIDTGGAELKLVEASIHLNAKLERLAAGALHELLHMALPIRGFNLINKITDTQAIHPDDEHRFQEVVPMITNIVQHDVFRQEFVDTGLPLAHFLAGRTFAPRYEEEAKRFKGKVLIPDRAWLAWSWWAFEHLNNYISVDHGDPQARQLADGTRKWGPKVLPGFEKTADEIEAWVGNRAHCKLESYNDSLREIFSILRLPMTLHFCVLKPVANGIPAVEEVV